MTVKIFAETGSGNPHVPALPVLSIERLDADPHGVFRQYRREYAVVRHETGAYFVLRFGDVDRLGRDPQFGPSGTSFPEALGISNGAAFDLARAELEESLSAITARIPQLHLDAPPKIKGHMGVRRIDAAMRVSWKP